MSSPVCHWPRCDLGSLEPKCANFPPPYPPPATWLKECLRSFSWQLAVSSSLAATSCLALAYTLALA